MCKNFCCYTEKQKVSVSTDDSAQSSAAESASDDEKEKKKKKKRKHKKEKKHKKKHKKEKAEYVFMMRWKYTIKSQLYNFILFRLEEEKPTEEPTTYSSITPEEVPEIPENKFLQRSSRNEYVKTTKCTEISSGILPAYY